MTTRDASLQEPRSRSLLSLLGDLKDDCGKLARQEAQLAKLEIKENAARAGRLSALIAAGAMVALAGFTVLLIGLGSFLAVAFGENSGALAAGQLIIGLLATSAGGLTAYLASKKLPDQSLMPSQALAILKSSARNVRDDVSQPEPTTN